MIETVVVIVLLLVVAINVWLVRRVFRHGARQRFLSDLPLWKILWWSVGYQLALAAVDWLVGRDHPKPLTFRLETGALLLLSALAIWFAGFAFGRRRAAKREGVLMG